jgi:hypothetical protein
MCYGFSINNYLFSIYIMAYIKALTTETAAFFALAI